MPSKEDFDSALAKDQERVSRKCHAQIRKAVENAGAEEGMGGGVTAWVVIAEFSGFEDGYPVHGLYVTHAYADDTPLVPWTIRGLLETALDGVYGE